MVCRYCQKEPDIVVAIPELCEQADLSQSPFSCVSCALEQGIYCPIHSQPHMIFQPHGHTACRFCIEHEAMALYRTVDDLLIELRSINHGEIVKLLAASAVVMMSLGLSPAMTICRWIATRMVVYKMTREQVIAEAIERNKLDLVVPPEIYADL